MYQKHDTREILTNIGHSNFPAPSKAITSLAWRPMRKKGTQHDMQRELAIASEDSSLRIYSFALSSQVVE